MPRKSRPLTPTMTDVARLAGVSQSCVSLVLNNAPGSRLPESTRQRVHDAAQSLGYRMPGQKQHGEAATTKNVVAYIVDEISVSPHAVIHVDGARDAAWTRDCTVQTYVTRGNEELEAATLATIRRDPSIAGVIYASSFLRQVQPPEDLRAIPTVLVDCYTQESHYPTLLPDETVGGRSVTSHLIDHRHRRIGMIGGEAWMDAARDRLQGYREALIAARIKFDPELVREGDWSAASGYRHTLDLMQLKKPPTALFCANDMMAFGCFGALAEMGLSVPGDVSVVGYNDLELARNVRPSLSSCRLPSYQLGQRAADILLDAAARGKRPRATVTKVECELVARASVARRGATQKTRANS